MVKYQEISLWTDESNFDKARYMLKNRYGLVPPKNDPFGRTERDILVWEDDLGIGRYRVHFDNHPDGHLIYFRYWMIRLTPEIEETDPMLETARQTHDLVKPYRTTISKAGVITDEFTGAIQML